MRSRRAARSEAVRRARGRPSSRVVRSSPTAARCSLDVVGGGSRRAGRRRLLRSPGSGHPAPTTRRCLDALRTREVGLPEGIADPPACCIISHFSLTHPLRCNRRARRALSDCMCAQRRSCPTMHRRRVGRGLFRGAAARVVRKTARHRRAVRAGWPEPGDRRNIPRRTRRRHRREARITPNPTVVEPRRPPLCGTSTSGL